MRRSGTYGRSSFQGDQLQAACYGEPFCVDVTTADGFTRNTRRVSTRLTTRAGAGAHQRFQKDHLTAAVLLGGEHEGRRSCCAWCAHHAAGRSRPSSSPICFVDGHHLRQRWSLCHSRCDRADAGLSREVGRKSKKRQPPLNIDLARSTQMATRPMLSYLQRRVRVPALVLLMPRASRPISMIWKTTTARVCCLWVAFARADARFRANIHAEKP